LFDVVIITQALCVVLCIRAIEVIVVCVEISVDICHSTTLTVVIIDITHWITVMCALEYARIVIRSSDPCEMSVVSVSTDLIVVSCSIVVIVIIIREGIIVVLQ